MWGARIQSGPTGYGPGFTVLIRYTPSLPDRIVAEPSKFGSSGAGLRSFGCTYRPKVLACQMVNLAPGTGLPWRSRTRPVTSMISPWACPSVPCTIVRSPWVSGLNPSGKKGPRICWGVRISIFRLEPGCLHDRPPPVEFGPDQPREFFRGVTGWRERQLCQTGFDIVGVERGADCGVKGFDRLHRGLCRHEDAEPIVLLNNGISEFSGRRHVRKRRASLCSRGQERPELSRLDVRKRNTRRKYRCRNPTCQQILHRGQTLIGHMSELESRSARQRDTDEMMQRTSADRTVCCQLGIGAAPQDEISKCLHLTGHHRPHREQEREIANGRDGRKILQRIEIELLVDMRNDGHRRRSCQKQGRAVGGAGLHSFERDAFACAGPVFDNERRGIVLHRRGQQPCRDVECPAWAESHHDTRAPGAGLSLRRLPGARDHRCQASR